MLRSRPSVIVLAAGRGSRFDGSPNKLAQLLGASSVLQTTLEHAVASELPVVVVTTQALVPLARSRVGLRDIVILPEVGSEPGLGLGHSIASGVAARAEAPGWVVLPGDMPLVRPSTIVAVAKALAQHPVAYAQHEGRAGQPVAFAAELYSELVLLQGDDGTKRLVARYPSLGVDVDDPGTLLDLDTADDLSALRAAMGHVAPLALRP